MNPATPKPKTRHYFEWLALKWVLGHIRKGDINDANRKVRRLTPFFQKILRSEMGWAQRNLQMIYGDNLSSEQRRVLVRLSFENVLFSYLEGMRVTEIRFEDVNVNRLLDAVNLGRGVLACSVHIGSWEPGLKHLSDLSKPVETGIVYRHANNPLSEAEFSNIRAPYGVDWIRRDQPRQILQTIKDGKVLGMMTDMNTRDGAVTAPFLGVPAQCPPGAARFSLRFGAPIIPIVAIRTAPGVASFIVLPVLEPQQKRKFDEADVAALTTKLNNSFTEMVHEYAEQYNWLHARWRSRSDGSLWNLDMPLATMHAARVDSGAPFPKVGERVLKLIEERLG